MRIWHQSFTVLDDVPHYRDALAAAPDAQVAAPDTESHLHGMKPGHLPERLPGHPHQVRLPVRPAQGAVRPRRAARAGRGLRRLPHRDDPRHRPTRSAAPLVDIPVVAFGQTSVLMAATLGLSGRHRQLHRRARAAAAAQPAQLRPRPAGRADPAGGRRVHRRHGGLRRPPSGCSTRSAPRPARRSMPGATVIVPGEGPLNVFLADHGVSRVDDVPVLDSLGTLLQVAELRARQYRSAGLAPSRRGFHHEQPPRELARPGPRLLRRPGRARPLRPLHRPRSQTCERTSRSTSSSPEPAPAAS